MATIKEVIQNFCYLLNLPAPSAIVGVSSPTEQQYLALFKFIGDNLRNRSYNWPQLKRGYTITTQTGVRTLQLPGDFYRLLESSQWDTTNNWPLRGPISDYHFAVREFAVVSLQTRKAFRIIGPTGYLYNTGPYNQRSAGYFEIDPAGVNDTDQLFLGYLSCNYVWPIDWVANTAYVVGDIRSGNGTVLICTTSGTSGTTRPSILSGTVTDGTVVWTAYHEPYLVMPSNTKLTDNDICLFDEDMMVEGMQWAYYASKKMDFNSYRQDWENKVKGAVARFNGPTRISQSEVFGDYFDWPNVPAGSWNI